MARVTVSIAYLVNDTVTHLQLRGYRHSAQIWSNGKGIVKIFDKNGNRREIWMGCKTISVHVKTKYPAPGEERY